MIKSYHDLDVWTKGRELVKLIYKLTKSFPRDELYGLTSQLRRAVISIPSNIAEGHSRHSTKDYVNFVSVAIGSLAEVDTQTILAQDLEYVTAKDCEAVNTSIQSLQRMLHALRQSLKAKL
jgi:four helix bundle protein